MWKYFRAVWRSFSGLFSGQYNKLQSNKHVIEATYEAAISKGRSRQQAVTESVASLMSTMNQRVTQIKEEQASWEKHTQLKKGAAAKMQAIINAGKSSGKTKEQIEADPEFIKWSGWFRDASSSLDLVSKSIGEKETEVSEYRSQIDTYKLELQKMQKSVNSLSEEKDRTIADVEIAKQRTQINNALSGIAQDTTDQDLAAVRRARENIKSQAQISVELNNNSASLAEAELIAMASNSVADKELEGILNWGDESTNSTKLEDAKLPE